LSDELLEVVHFRFELAELNREVRLLLSKGGRIFAM
jgi:hypothetical protein